MIQFQDQVLWWKYLSSLVNWLGLGTGKTRREKLPYSSKWGTWLLLLLLQSSVLDQRMPQSGSFASVRKIQVAKKVRVLSSFLPIGSLCGLWYLDVMGECSGPFYLAAHFWGMQTSFSCDNYIKLKLSTVMQTNILSRRGRGWGRKVYSLSVLKFVPLEA